MSQGPPRHDAIADLIAGGRRRAPQLLDEIGAVTGDREQLAAWLDPLAAAAADAPVALEVLVECVYSLDLARPAIRRLVFDPQTVDDIAQDVLIKVARSIGSFDGRSRFTTWLYQIARNTAIDHLRRRQAEPTDRQPTETERISSLIATRTDLAAALATLPDSYRQPLLLRDVHHLPYDDIAGRLGLNLNTTKSRIARGRAMAAAALRHGA